MVKKCLLFVLLLLLISVVACTPKKHVVIKTVPEGGEIEIVDIGKWPSPIEKKLKFPKGKKYKVIAQKKGFYEKESFVSYQPKEKVEYEIVLDKHKKDVEINSNPSGASVYVNGKMLGETPFKEVLFLTEVKNTISRLRKMVMRTICLI